MKKTFAALAVLLTALMLSISVFADSNFTVTDDGILTKYSGSDTEVVIPRDVKSIAAGAFEASSGIKYIVFENSQSTFEAGSLPSGITVIAPESSQAFFAADSEGLNFRALDGFTPITIHYKYSSGESALDSYIGRVETGKPYRIAVEQIDGFTPNVSYVTGYAGYSDITVSVVYTANRADGWSMENGRAKYVKNGKFLTDTTENIDGTPYSFDENGCLIMASGFLNTGSDSYYLVNGVAVTGYRIIGKSIYCFKNDGTMIRGTSYDGHEFDIGGNLLASDALVTIGSDKYYLIANELFSGFRSINGNIMYFGDDYKLVRNSTVNGYTFASDGALSSGIKASELEISGLTDVAYTGEAYEPAITVKFKGITLTLGVHYKLTYLNNTAPGEATIELRGIGAVSGTASFTFKIIGEDAYTLTVRYVNIMGAPVAEPYTALLEPGEEFTVESPEVEGYKPDQLAVSGIMGNSDMSFSVTYTKDSNESESESESSSDASSDSTSVSDTSSKQSTSDEPEESTSETVKNNASQGYKYDYALFFKVLVISTAVAGLAIVVILNWDVIKKAVAKKFGKKNNSDKRK